jgi:hypothetical protein
MDPRMDMIYTDLEEVQDQMQENISKMTVQVVNLEDLDQKIETMKQNSNEFKKEGSRLHIIAKT